MRDSVRRLAGEGVDPAGVVLARLLRLLANKYEAAGDESLREIGLSGPRWELLVRLMMEQQAGRGAGVSPSHLSRCQHVSKNTISALLSGLECGGLVERSIDPTDKRAFLIRLTETGRATVLARAPGRVAFLNALAAGMTGDEVQRLIELLMKLHGSVADHQQASMEQPDAGTLS
jgi:DNA-binding MarR family transcriptional regulator